MRLVRKIFSSPRLAERKMTEKPIGSALPLYLANKEVDILTRDLSDEELINIGGRRAAKTGGALGALTGYVGGDVIGRIVGNPAKNPRLRRWAGPIGAVGLGLAGSAVSRYEAKKEIRDRLKRAKTFSDQQRDPQSIVGTYSGRGFGSAIIRPASAIQGIIGGFAGGMSAAKASNLGKSDAEILDAAESTGGKVGAGVGLGLGVAGGYKTGKFINNKFGWIDKVKGSGWLKLTPKKWDLKGIATAGSKGVKNAKIIVPTAAGFYLMTTGHASGGTTALKNAKARLLKREESKK